MTRTAWPSYHAPLIIVDWYDDGRVHISKSKKLRGAALLLTSVALVTQFQRAYFRECQDDD
jgi:hypothetical protein